MCPRCPRPCGGRTGRNARSRLATRPGCRSSAREGLSSPPHSPALRTPSHIQSPLPSDSRGGHPCVEFRARPGSATSTGWFGPEGLSAQLVPSPEDRHTVVEGTCALVSVVIGGRQFQKKK